MGKNKKVHLQDDRGKKILHPADVLRKKAKAKQREKIKKDRKDNFEQAILHKSPQAIEAELRELKDMEAAGKLTKWKKDKMTREQTFYTKLKGDIQENHQKRLEGQKRDPNFVDFEELKVFRKFSVFYDAVKNPYGAPPNGQTLMYRHPDGSVKREPPYGSEDASRPAAPGHQGNEANDDEDSDHDSDGQEGDEADDDDDEFPLLPSELPSGQTVIPILIGGSSSSLPPLPPGPPPGGLPPLPPGPPPKGGYGMPPGAGPGLRPPRPPAWNGPPQMPNLSQFGAGSSIADFAAQMQQMGFKAKGAPPQAPQASFQPDLANHFHGPPEARIEAKLPPGPPPGTRPPPPPPKALVAAKAEGSGPVSRAATVFTPTALRTKKPSQLAGGVLQVSSSSLSQEARKRTLLTDRPQVSEKVNIEDAFKDFMEGMDG